MPRRIKNSETEGQNKHPRTQEFRPNTRRRQRPYERPSPTKNESPMCEETKTIKKRNPYRISKEEIENYKEMKKRAFYVFLVFVRIYIWRTKFVELEFLNSIIFGLLIAVAQAEERVYREENKTNFYQILWFFCIFIFIFHFEELEKMDKITGGTMAISLCRKLISTLFGSFLGAYIGQFETILRDEHVGGATGGMLGFVIAEMPRRRKSFGNDVHGKQTGNPEGTGKAPRRRAPRKRPVSRRQTFTVNFKCPDPTDTESPIFQANNADFHNSPMVGNSRSGVSIEEMNEYNEEKWRMFYRFLMIVKFYIWKTKFQEIEFLNSVILGLITSAAQAEHRVNQLENESLWKIFWSPAYFYRRLLFICSNILTLYFYLFIFVFLIMHITQISELEKVMKLVTVMNKILLKMSLPCIGATLGAYCGHRETILRDESVGGVAGALLGHVVAEVLIKQFPFYFLITETPIA